MIGPAARDSTNTKSGSNRMLATISAMISGELHAQVMPPRLVKRMTVLSAAARRPAPR
jgi:hypothetical protein